MHRFGHVSCVLLAVLLCGSPAFAQVEIRSIDFDSIPPGTTFAGSAITLQGDTVVQGGLQVDGQLSLGLGGSIAFDPPRQGSLMVGAGDFVPSYLLSNYAWGVGDYYFFPTAGFSLLQGVAPVHLPSGAVVTSFRCWFYDNDALLDFDSTTNAQLIGRFPNGLSGGTYFWATGLGVPHQEDALIEVVGSVVLSPLVIDSSHTYSVTFGMSLTGQTTAGNTFRFYGCRIDYEVSTWAP